MRIPGGIFPGGRLHEFGLEQLEPQERRLIYLRYFADKTQTEVGKLMGISQVQVSRMEKKILERMREKI